MARYGALLEDIQVDRIDHGTDIVESPALVEEVKRRGIGLTCCPISNSFVTNDMESAEIVSLLRDGVRVTVNSDDPAYFGGSITENFASLAAHAERFLTELGAYAAAHGVS